MMDIDPFVFLLVLHEKHTHNHRRDSAGRNLVLRIFFRRMAPSIRCPYYGAGLHPLSFFFFHFQNFFIFFFFYRSFEILPGGKEEEELFGFVLLLVVPLMCVVEEMGREVHLVQFKRELQAMAAAKEGEHTTTSQTFESFFFFFSVYIHTHHQLLT